MDFVNKRGEGGADFLAQLCESGHATNAKVRPVGSRPMVVLPVPGARHAPPKA